MEAMCCAVFEAIRLRPAPPVAEGVRLAIACCLRFRQHILAAPFPPPLVMWRWFSAFDVSFSAGPLQIGLFLVSTFSWRSFAAS